MRNLPALTLAALLSCAAAPAALADGSDAALQTGQRVRVTAAELGGSRLVGSVVALDAQTLTVQVAGRPEPVTVPRTAIARLEVSQGRRSRATFALIGGLVGGLVGYAVGAHDNSAWSFQPQVSIATAALGVLAGSLVGAAVPPGERWKALPQPARGVQLVPRPDLGAGIGVRVAF